MRFWQVEPGLWARMLAINVNGPFYLEHEAVPGMIERGWGRVINVTTTFQTMLSFEVYGPSKAALEALSCIAANALKGTGVTVNIVIPGGPADTAQVTADIGTPRSAWLPPAVMMPPVVWLCSDEASAISGCKFSAADWDGSLPPLAAVERVRRPIVWPELITRIVVPEGARLNTR